MKWMHAAGFSWSCVGQVDEIASLICCAVMLAEAPATNKGWSSCGLCPSRSHKPNTCRPPQTAFRLTLRRIITSSSIICCHRACLSPMFTCSMSLQLEWFSKVLNAQSSESWSSSSDVTKLNCVWITNRVKWITALQMQYLQQIHAISVSHGCVALVWILLKFYCYFLLQRWVTC